MHHGCCRRIGDDAHPLPALSGFPGEQAYAEVYWLSVNSSALCGDWLLIVYCLKNVTVLEFPFGVPEGIAVLAVAGPHFWKKNMLLSIAGGTLVYMLLVQFVFV